MNVSATAGALLLTHGAGSDRTHPALVAIEEAIHPLPVERIDFPYRREGRRAPDRAPKLVACIEEAAANLVGRARIRPDRLVLGGRSLGGRMCSLAVAGGLPAAGLVLISYPLHPPGRPDQLRVDHFGSLERPCLFVSGTRDPFGAEHELELHTASIPGPVTQVWIEGAGHGLRGADAEVASAVKAWLRGLGRRG
ncbi:MAG: alpha/beta hydrolase family protein [Acidimicrobiales bacterium]